MDALLARLARVGRGALILLSLVAIGLSLVSFESMARVAVGAAVVPVLVGLFLFLTLLRDGLSRLATNSLVARQEVLAGAKLALEWALPAVIAIALLVTVESVVRRAVRTHADVKPTILFEQASEVHQTLLASINRSAIVLDSAAVVTLRGGLLVYGVRPVTRDLLMVNSLGGEMRQVHLAVAKASDGWVIGAGVSGTEKAKPIVFLSDTLRVLKVGPTFAKFRVNIAPEDSAPSRFGDSTEIIVLSDSSLHLSHVVHGVESRKSGLFTRSLRFGLLNAGPSGQVDVALANNTRLVGTLCDRDCPTTEVEVTDLPRSSFYEALEYDSVPVVETFETLEQASWRMREVRRGIAFSYVERPYRPFRPALKPVLWVASFPTLVLYAIGFAIAGVSVLAAAKYLLSALPRRVRDGSGKSEEEAGTSRGATEPRKPAQRPSEGSRKP